MKFYLLCLTALFAPFAALQAEESRGDISSFVDLEKQHTGSRIGIAGIDPATNRRVEYHANERFLMCSTFKVLAVAAVLKRVDDGKEKLDRFVSYSEGQLLSYAPVTREHVKEGGMTLDALCAAAIQESDNTAANLLLESIGGPGGVTDIARSLGDTFTRLDRNEPSLNVASKGDERDTTTPAAMGRDLERLFTSDFLSAASRERLERWMQGNKTGAGLIRASVPADWQVGDKTGRSGQGETNDIAILRPPSSGPVFLTIYSVNASEPEEARQKLIADAAKIALKEFKR
jgi:beta-lactamase class A